MRQTLTSLTSSCVELSTSWKIQHTSNSFPKTFAQTHCKSLETPGQKSSSEETKSERTANPAELKIKITLEKTTEALELCEERIFMVKWTPYKTTAEHSAATMERACMKFSWIHFTFIASGKCFCKTHYTESWSSRKTGTCFALLRFTLWLEWMNIFLVDVWKVIEFFREQVKKSKRYAES